MELCIIALFHLMGLLKVAGYVIWTSFRTYSKSFALHFMIVGCSWKHVKRQKISGRLSRFFISTKK